MNEKFKDMLPLTPEQREFLIDGDNNMKCKKCFLSSLVRNGLIICGDFVRGKTWVNYTCQEVRAEALLLDDEYRKANR